MNVIHSIDDYLTGADPDGIAFGNDTSSCPCRPFRSLQEDDAEMSLSPTASPTVPPEEEVKLWEILYTTGVLIFLFGALITERVGADSVMLTCLTLFLLSGIITMKEGLAGFSNEGVLTVMVLYIVAEGISRTGALDWYMSKLLGRPQTNASAQLRLMIPVTFVSAFMNNTPLVAIMIPVVQRWAKNVNVPVQQLMIPLSFAAIYGGTCTLIGTSTNLVVNSLLQDEFPDDPDMVIGLFDLGVYGVPMAVAGVVYMVLFSPWLLPGGSRRRNDEKRGIAPLETGQEDILLGARLPQWSPAAGRSVKRSGLRETGGIYLVSVHRAATGNVHRAVGQDFVLNAGDVLYFTGLIEEFGDFCEEHGLEILTNELVTPKQSSAYADVEGGTQKPSTDLDEDEFKETEKGPVYHSNALQSKTDLTPVNETKLVPTEIGLTKESLLQADEAERSRELTRMIGKICLYDG
jgi:di/tricarboxylate transporter